MANALTNAIHPSVLRDYLLNMSYEEITMHESDVSIDDMNLIQQYLSDRINWLNRTLEDVEFIDRQKADEICDEMPILYHRYLISTCTTHRRVILQDFVRQRDQSSRS